jgi:hypothetical protein
MGLNYLAGLKDWTGATVEEVMFGITWEIFDVACWEICCIGIAADLLSSYAP